MKPLLIVKNNLNFIKKSTDATALDLGAGCGRNTIFLAKKGFIVDAIDKSQKSLIILNNNAKKEQVNNRINTKNTNLSVFSTDKTYNLVLITNVLHLLDPKTQEKLLKQCPLLLKKGGTLIISHILDGTNLTPRQIEKSLANLKILKKEIKTINDSPHPKMPYPHQHKIIFYIFQK